MSIKKSKEKSIVLFEQKKIRRLWDDEKELWYFSVVDIVESIVQTDRPRKYWNDLKIKLISEGSQPSEKIGRLKMKASDGKMRDTDVADTETILRLIQSIPSPKAEPFKLWLAQVGYERMEEIEDPEKAFDRAMKTYLQKGHSKEWINQRLKTIEVRKELTDQWVDCGIKAGLEFAILTDEITKAWSGLTTKEYKNHKGLRKQNLRDNMTNLELILNMLAEASTTEILKVKKPKGLKENEKVAIEGGSIAGNARKNIEKITKIKVISKGGDSSGQNKLK